MIDTDKITPDRRSRTSSPSLPSLSTSSDISSIHARSTPKIAAGIIASVIALGCVIGIAFYFVSSESPESRPDPIKNDRISSSIPQFVSFDSQKRLDVISNDIAEEEPSDEKKEVATEQPAKKEDVRVPFFPQPVLRNHLRTKYTDGQDPEGPLQEDNGVYYRSRELTIPPEANQENSSSTTTASPPETTASPSLSKRSRNMIPSSGSANEPFEPFVPYASLRGQNVSDFGARRRGFIRENMNNPMLRRQNGFETISTLMDRRPGRLPFHPEGPFPQNEEEEETGSIPSQEENVPQNEFELRKGLISNIYQLVGNAKTEMSSPPPLKPQHPLLRRGDKDAARRRDNEKDNFGEHPESIFARFIAKFRDRLTKNGPWGGFNQEPSEGFEGRNIHHHSTSSLLFISLGILLMNALSGTKEESLQDRSFQAPPALELESIFEGMLSNDSRESNSSLNMAKYVQLLQGLRDMNETERPLGVDCIWQKFCGQLNGLSYSDDSVLKFVARLNSVGMKLIMSGIQGYELLSQFSEAYKAWQPIPCEDIFKLCDPERLAQLEQG